MQAIDKFLNNTTMYRLVVYVLGALSALSIIFAFMGHLSSSPTELVVSLSLLIVSAYVVDRGFGRVFNVPTNMESSLITAMIIFLIVQPADSLASGLALVLAGAVSSASKFLLSWNGKHIFNPAALAAAVVSLTNLQPTTWWVGSSVFWPFTLLLGLAVVRKIRRFPLLASFVAVSIALQALLFVQAHQPLADMKQVLVASPLIFLATIMLTEPATMPPHRNMQIIFAALVAVLYVTAWQVGPLIIYPEVALLFGNIFAYIVSPRFRVRLELKEIQKISDHVYSYVFLPEHRFAFLPGQYMEWTLAGVPYDSRGNRRTFTIASSPTESEIHLGLKYYEPASMYKATFEQLQPGDTVYASQLAGNFTLKGSEHKPLAFIAGGIGITPFRSMVKYLTDTNASVDIVLLYVVSDAREFAYVNELKAASKVGIRTIPVVTAPGDQSPGTVHAQLDAALIQQLVPDYADRKFYISGPDAMVHAVKKYLHTIGTADHRIVTDYFSGY
jgi:ferredoxin-NADP reductase/Na+-translocating ferredoxin:NAD+ oxidoreductase RnfD subunit